jgi:hypothetical protein
MTRSRRTNRDSLPASDESDEESDTKSPQSDQKVQMNKEVIEKLGTGVIKGSK